MQYQTLHERWHVLSDGNGQNSHYITENGFGRRPKMKKSGKIFDGVEFDRKINRKLG
jgi:hypothetical protein